MVVKIMNKNHIIVSKWLIGIIVVVLIAIIPMSVGIIYNQGKQSTTIEYIADSVFQIKEIVKRMAQQDIVLATHDERISNLEREIYDGNKTPKAR